MKEGYTLKSLTLLLTVFTIGMVSLIVLNYYFDDLDLKVDQELRRQVTKLKIAHYIETDINHIEANFFELAIVANNEYSRNIILKKIRNKIRSIKKALAVLDNGGILKRDIYLNLVDNNHNIELIEYNKKKKELSVESIEIMPKLDKFEKMLIQALIYLNIRDNKNHKLNNEEFKKLNRKIRYFYKRVPTFFRRMNENIQRLDFEGNKNLKILQQKAKEEKEYYNNIKLILVLSIIAAVLIIGIFIVKQVANINKNLESKIQDEIKKSQKKDQLMLEQSRLAQMGEMLSMIAHQWRQPLSAISASASVIYIKASRDKLDNKTAVELANKITGFSKHLSSTIDDFRDFFKSNKVQNKTDFEKVVKSVLDIVSVSLEEKSIKLNIKTISLSEFETYENEIKQVLLNLIKNAEDALVENNIENPSINIEINNNVLIISDNAGGIPNDIIDKIFDLYFSTKTKKDGTGLGLYMSKTIIEEHCGGKLDVVNDSNGAVFTITMYK